MINSDVILILLNTLIAYFLQAIVIKVGNLNTTFNTRVQLWFSVKIFLKTFRYSLFTSFILLILNERSNLSKIAGDSGSLINLSFRVFNFHSLLYICITTFIVANLVYFLFNSAIRQNFSKYDYKKVEQYEGYQSYTISTLIFVTITAALLYFSQYLIYSIHIWFISKGAHPFDWLFASNNIIEDYKKGIYFSFILSTIITFFTINAFYKTKHSGNHSNDVRYIVLSLIIWIGLLSGFYSITNGYYNNINHNNFLDWYKQDKQLGIFAFRLSSLILLYHLLAFLIKYVLKDIFLSSILSGFLPNYESKSRYNILSDKDYSTTFLPQIGFYILNLSIAEITIAIKEHSVFRDIIGFALFFIIDDYVIIHDYSKKLGSILRWHTIRIIAFNTILLVSGALMLISFKLYFALVIYLIISFLLFWLYSSNITKLEKA